MSSDEIVFEVTILSEVTKASNWYKPGFEATNNKRELNKMDIRKLQNYILRVELESTSSSNGVEVETNIIVI